MGKLVEVKLGEHRPVYKYDTNGVDCVRDDLVIIEADRGTEFGRVISDREVVCAGKTETAAGKILRKVTDGDINQIHNNRLKSRDAINTCLRKVSERRLDMRIAKAEYTFDCGKIIFFFTADGRVDFRELVKDLAKIFRVRIELKQIGVRDKAKIVGGYGVCGRELCCSSFMKGFHPLSIKMAKEQGLPLNPSRISGVCGRIKCCMAYEFLVYKEFSRDLPRIGERIQVKEGKGKVIEVNILKRLVHIEMKEGHVVKTEIAKK